MTNVTNPSKYLASCLGQLSFRNVTNVTNPTNKYLAWDGSQFEMWQMWQIRLIFGYIWLGAHFEIYVTNVTNPTNMSGLHLAWCPFRNVTNVTNPTNIWLETAPNSKCDKLMWQIRWIFVQIRQMWLANPMNICPNLHGPNLTNPNLTNPNLNQPTSKYLIQMWNQ